MRNVELNELNLKNDCDEEMFYQLFLKGLKTEIKENGIFKKPSKEYEIFYLNILGGKIILLKKIQQNKNCIMIIQLLMRFINV